MKLKDVLLKRSERDLYQMVFHRDLLSPGITDPEDRKKLFELYYQDEDERNRYIEEVEEPVELEPAPKRMSKKDREHREWLIAYHAQRRHLGELLLEVRKRKEAYAGILADELVKRDHIREFLESLRDEASRALDEILAGGIIPDEEGFFALSVSPEEKYGFEAFETAGYALIRRTDWREEDDERVHFTGIMISEDVLSLLRELETKELKEKRRFFNALDACCALAGSYYAVTPFSQIRRLYQLIRKEDPDRYPDPDENTFEQLMHEFGKKKNMTGYIIHYRGTDYVSSIFESDDLSDETDQEDSYIVALIMKQKECEYDFYQPSVTEIMENGRKGFPAEKQCYCDLEQFIREAYLDEKYMSDMQSSMFRMVITDPNDDWGKKSYSMDMVDQNTNDQMADLLFTLKDGYGPLKTFKDQENFYAMFREEAKERFRELLIACFEEMNEPWFLGHTNREVQEQGFDDPWDLSDSEDDDHTEEEDED